MARRKLDFHWNLRRLMAAHQMWKTTELIPLLRERGVGLSASQVYRLVTDKPERLSMKVLIALCDILDCTPNDLLPLTVAPAEGDRNDTMGGVASQVRQCFSVESDAPDSASGALSQAATRTFTRSKLANNRGEESRMDKAMINLP